ASSRPSPSLLRTLATSTATNTPSPATSTSAAQPFSTPLSPSPPASLGDPAPQGANKPGKEKKGKGKGHATVQSSCPAGTVLKGLNFVKGKADPVAGEDGEYPAWLWGVLKEGERRGEGEGDLFSKSKKQRRIAAKRLRKQALLNPDSLVPKVPVYEQSIDLEAGDGTTQGAGKAMEAREGLTKAMRDKRRATIKEANFLKAM
ncbi:hypothetical protein M501DRAFT_918510, partial [Patellaria atrata CBS 101060]